MSAATWLEPVKPMLASWMAPGDWQMLASFERSLAEIAKDGSEHAPLQVKKLLASQGYGMVDIERELGGKGRSPLLQAFMQFICGYHDLDYRDAAHVGHGRMIAIHGSERQRDLWMPMMDSGSLVGIAATEAHGGSRVQAAKATARSTGISHFLTGEKVHISRIKEAAVFVVFFKFEKDVTLSAALITPSHRGVTTEAWNATGLQGWSWGRVILEDVPFTDRDLLGPRGQGMAIFKEHFVYYRPMVAMVTCGAAAAVLDLTREHIRKRIREKDIEKPRDTCLEAMANHYAAINAGMLSAVCAIVQQVENSAHACLWSRMVKAWSVEQAHRAVSELALLMGATAFRNDHFVAKALRDLRGFLLADGIHDALRRSAGATLLQRTFSSEPNLRDRLDEAVPTVRRVTSATVGAAEARENWTS